MRWLVLPAWLFLTASSVVKCQSSGSALIRDDDFFNEAPLALDDEFMASVNEPLMESMRATDADGDELVFSIVETPRLGVVTIDDTSTGAFTYIASVEGDDVFSFVVTDGQAESNRATITIAVDAEIVQFSEREGGKPAARCEAATAEAAVDPFEPNHRLRFTGTALEHSVDGGRTWHRTGPAGARFDAARISFSVDLPGLIYVGFKRERGSSAIIRSRDGGRNWRLIARLDGELAAVRSAKGRTPDSTTVTVELCDRAGELVAVDRPWRR